MSANSATKVGEIFTEAGKTFNLLGELIQNLRESRVLLGPNWADEELTMLHNSLITFSTDMTNISEFIKGKTVSQIRATLRKKAFEDAGLPVPAPQQVPSQTPTRQPRLIHYSSPLQSQMTSSMRNSEVTLNMLNASESEIDVEILPEGKLDFEGGSEEMP